MRPAAFPHTDQGFLMLPERTIELYGLPASKTGEQLLFTSSVTRCLQLVCSINHDLHGFWLLPDACIIARRQEQDLVWVRQNVKHLQGFDSTHVSKQPSDST